MLEEYAIRGDQPALLPALIRRLIRELDYMVEGDLQTDRGRAYGLPLHKAVRHHAEQEHFDISRS